MNAMTFFVDLNLVCSKLASIFLKKNTVNVVRFSSNFKTTDEVNKPIIHF